MISDIREYEINYKQLKQLYQEISHNQAYNEKIDKEMRVLDESWFKLEKSVENRIFLSTIYLEFVKSVNEFRNCAVDIDELINAFNNLSPMTGSQSINAYEKHIDKKIETFDNLFSCIVKNTNQLISELKNVI